MVILNEQPVHSVTLSSFMMAQYATTQDTWQTVMHNNPSYFNNGGSYPVDQVSWDNCQAFLRQDWTASAHRGRMGICLPGRYNYRLLLGQ